MKLAGLVGSPKTSSSHRATISSVIQNAASWLVQQAHPRIAGPHAVFEPEAESEVTRKGDRSHDLRQAESPRPIPIVATEH